MILKRILKRILKTAIGLFPWEEPAFLLSKTPADLRKEAPCLGQDNAYMYTEFLGMCDEEFVELTEEGVFE